MSIVRGVGWMFESSTQISLCDWFNVYNKVLTCQDVLCVSFSFWICLCRWYLCTFVLGVGLHLMISGLPTVLFKRNHSFIIVSNPWNPKSSYFQISDINNGNNPPPPKKKAQQKKTKKLEKKQMHCNHLERK